MQGLGGQHSRGDDVHGHAPFLTWNTLLQKLARSASCPACTRFSGETLSSPVLGKPSSTTRFLACIDSPILTVTSALAISHDRLHENRVRPTVPARIESDRPARTATFSPTFRPFIPPTITLASTGLPSLFLLLRYVRGAGGCLVPSASNSIAAGARARRRCLRRISTG